VGKRRKIPVVQPDPVRTLHGSIPVESLDLHGLHADVAEARVRSFVEAWSRRESGAILRIITGKGLNSEGPPVLRTMLLELLNDGLSHRIDDWAGETGGGSYLVRLK
jgi:DNA-nicking Smr family endonuclease